MLDTLKKVPIGLVFVTLVLALPGCEMSDKNSSTQNISSPTDFITQSERKTIFNEIEDKATGISVGAKNTNKIAYVFFDPQCDHCGHLWRSAQNFSDQVQFVWIPVSFLGPKSTSLAAHILDADDQLTALRVNEENVSNGVLTQIDGESDPDTAAIVLKNTNLLVGLTPANPINSVPFTFYRDETGSIELIPGAMPPDALGKALHLQATFEKRGTVK